MCPAVQDGLLGPEDEGTANYSPNNTVSHPRRFDSSATLLWEPNISHCKFSIHKGNKYIAMQNSKRYIINTEWMMVIISIMHVEFVLYYSVKGTYILWFNKNIPEFSDQMQTTRNTIKTYSLKILTNYISKCRKCQECPQQNIMMFQSLQAEQNQIWNRYGDYEWNLHPLSHVQIQDTCFHHIYMLVNFQLFPWMK